MKIVGIDPGLKGGLVMLGDGPPHGIVMPLNEDGRDINGAKVMAWLFVHDPDLVILEKVEARSMTDASGKAIRNAGNEFRFATGYGLIQGVLQACALRYRLVRPQAWKRKVLAGSDWSKQAAIEHVQHTLPELDLIPGRCRVPQDGLADAACLALWGQMREARQSQ